MFTKNKKATALVYISDLRNFAKTNPQYRMYLLVLLFTMAGFPPFVTALGKWYIFVELVRSDQHGLLFISVVIMALTIYYYIRIIKLLFFEPYAGTVNNQWFLYITPNNTVHYLLLSLIVFITVSPVLILWNYSYIIANVTTIAVCGETPFCNFTYLLSI